MPKIDVNKKRGDPNAQINLQTFWSEITTVDDPNNHILTGAWDFDFGHVHSRYQNKDNDLYIPLGRVNQGVYASMNLSIDLNVLAVGSALSGLGVFRRATIAHLIKTRSPEQLKIVIIDPIRSLGEFDDIPHLTIPRAVSPDEVKDALAWCATEHIRRSTLCSESNSLMYVYNQHVAPKEAEPSLLIVITELGEIDIENETVKNTIHNSLQLSRMTEEHFLLTTQQFTDSTFPEWLMSNVHCRVVFKLPYEKESLMLLGKSGAEDLLGQGDMIYSDGHDQWRLQGLHF